MDKKPLSVTALTKYIKYKFDQDSHLKDVLIKGEVSNFKRNVRGHFYFTLKDKNASISAIMFASKARGVAFEPKEGMSVVVSGYISVFEVAGSYQVYVHSMDEVGLGNLYQQYLQLKDTLEKAGYFAEQHKQALPSFPKQIAVLTSATGAAVRDIIHIINRRYPLCQILVYPTTVQGEQAKDEIVKNIEKANQNPNNDVIILGRGGGSIEDLWAFNEEIVAHAIYHSRVPIISAVGHETDFTIADFVADMRAPTPSGAAEIAVPEKRLLMRDVLQHQQRLTDILNKQITDHNRYVSQLLARPVLKDAARLLHPLEQQFDHLLHRLLMRHPQKQLSESFEQLSSQRQQLHFQFKRLVDHHQQRYRDLHQRLQPLNPRLLIEQGYMLGKVDGKLIKSIDDVKLGQTIELELQDGLIETKVEKKNAKEHSNE